MTIKDRIDEFISYKGLTVKAFEQEIGISNGLWAKAKSVSEDVLLKILGRYPQISSEWLLKGMGEMFASSNPVDDEVIRLREEVRRLKDELTRMSDPNLKEKENKVYNLWMKFMQITMEMQELYKEEKERK